MGSSRRMRFLSAYLILLVLVVAIAGATPPGGSALWIEVTERGNVKTTVALTEDVARQMLLSRDVNFHLNKHDNHEMITKEMLRSVLDGDREVLEVRDVQEGTEAKLFMKTLTPPEHRHGAGRLVLETWKDGRREFRMAIPQVDIEAASNEGEVVTGFGWKTFLPFMAREDGAVYIHGGKENSEIWIFVD